MRIRTVLLAAVLAVVGGVMAALVWSLSGLIAANVHAQAAEDLERSRQVFEELMAYRQSLFRAEIRVVAEEPRLKAVAATEEINHETVLGVALELRRAVGSELFLIADGRGRLLADTDDPDASGADVGQDAVIAAALAHGEGAGIWASDTSALQVQARRLTFGTTTVGVLVVGHRIDDRVAETVRRQTGSEAVIALDGRPIAVAVGAPKAAAVADGPPRTIEIAGESWLAVSAAVPGYGGAHTLRSTLLRSLERARAVERTLVRIVWLVGAGALLAALLLAFAVSRRVAGPADALVAFTERVAGGDLGMRARPSGLVELDALAGAMNRMVADLARARDEIAHKERLEKELEIAHRIQTSILPRRLEAPGLEVAAVMRPAGEVGGDYYDFLPVAGGAWIGIGDVAGHGLTAGLVMMMVQSIVAALTRDGRTVSPRDIVCRVNDVLFDNVRDRLANDEHVTFTLLRYHDDGRLVFAGAHEDIVIWRARTGVTEQIATPGTWLGAVPDIARVTIDSELRLEPGDVMLLYTDGATEAMDAHEEQFGLGRLCAALTEVAERPVDAARDHVLAQIERWAATQRDDVTLLVLRYKPA
jgi:sigma-B regulation protein RsbU (phosphoserine phosphatase)